MTRHDYQEMQEGPPYYQLVEGELVMSPSPTPNHQKVVGNIFNLIQNHLADHPVGEVYVAPLDVLLSETDVYQPDVFFMLKERRAIRAQTGIEGAPSLVVEVLSPGTERLDRGAKRQVYARTGVEELWLVDLDARTIEVFDLPKNPNVCAAVYGHGNVFGCRILPGLDIQVAAVFAGVV